MNDLILVTITFACSVIVIGGLAVIIIRDQQQSIDRLTNKLMAKDYTEYRRTYTVQEEKPKRKPLSFHDDPDIELDE